MAIYRYQSDSLIDFVQVITNDKGGQRAYLSADNAADSDKLRIVKQALREQGHKCVPTLQDGKPVLEVRGFKSPEALLELLDNLNALKGKPEHIAEASDTRTTKEKLSNATLKFAGLSYNVGDVSYLFYSAGPLIESWKTESKSGRFFGILNVVAGIGYGLGSLCLTFFGSRDQSINTITSATEKIERYARKEGYTITPDSSIAFTNSEPKQTLWGKVKSIIDRYPSEALNSIYVGVGLFLSAAAFYKATRSVESFKSFKELGRLKNEAANNFGAIEKAPAEDLKKITEAAADLVMEKKSQVWDRIDVGLGAVTATSAILGLAVKEEKRLEGEPKRTGIGGVIDWIREKPLRATGIGYGIATGFHTIATIGMWRDKSKHRLATKYLAGRAIFIAANVFSEIMLALSSKGHGTGVKPDASVDDSIIATAAELVLRQPADKREAVISQLSGYIASPEVLAIKAADVEKNLRQHLQTLNAHPWTQHYTPAKSADMPVESAVVATAKPAPSQSPSKPGNVISAAEYIAPQRHAELALAHA